ncbi:MAG: hypothetical protein GX205_11350 [Firmicutes bacterium]|jgi:uncharacterized protein YqgV (UPF0045/DUF77 family)|nr:hypothetical protein [Bacillota bacterium]
MLKAEVSVYPSDESGQEAHPLQRFMNEMGLDYDFRQEPPSINTSLSGSSRQVFSTVQEIFESSAQRDEDVVMVVTFYQISTQKN